ncbi:MAG: hypothetical protein V7727_20580 [Sneathiella sp.]
MVREKISIAAYIIAAAGFLLLLLLGYFGYEKIFHREQEHLLTLNGVPFLFPKWSVANARSDEQGPKQTITTYGMLPDFTTWNEDLKPDFHSRDPNYIAITLDRSLYGTNVVKNIKRNLAEDNSKGGYVTQLMSDLGLNKTENPNRARYYFFPMDKTLEEMVIVCTRPSTNPAIGTYRCQAYIDRHKYRIQYRFAPEKLPEWKLIYTKVADYIETLRQRGDQAISVTN